MIRWLAGATVTIILKQIELEVIMSIEALHLKVDKCDYLFYDDATPPGKPSVGRESGEHHLVFRVLVSRLVVSLMWNSVLSPYLPRSLKSSKAVIER